MTDSTSKIAGIFPKLFEVKNTLKAFDDFKKQATIVYEVILFDM